MTVSNLESPVGPLRVRSRGGRLIEVGFGASSVAEEPDAIVAEAGRQLGQYFAGERRGFELELEPPAGDGLLARALAGLAEIPYGEHVSYLELTTAIGLGRESVRDVGAMVGRNPLAIVVPCHRVIGSDGSLVGFGGGLAAKSELLAIEASQLRLAV